MGARQFQTPKARKKSINSSLNKDANTFSRTAFQLHSAVAFAAGMMLGYFCRGLSPDWAINGLGKPLDSLGGVI